MFSPGYIKVLLSLRKFEYKYTTQFFIVNITKRYLLSF